MAKLFFLIFTLFGLASCTTTQYFVVDSANYQPAVFNESSRITTIEVIVSNIKPNVEFTSLVFQNLRIPVSTEFLSDDKARVTGFIQIGGKLVEGQYQILTEETNRLYFIVEKRQQYIPLENIQRQSTQLP